MSDDRNTVMLQRTEIKKLPADIQNKHEYKRQRYFVFCERRERCKHDHHKHDVACTHFRMRDQTRVDDAGDECGYRYDERKDARSVAAFDDRTEQQNERHIRNEMLPIGVSEHVRKKAKIIERCSPIERVTAVFSARYDKECRRKVPIEYIGIEQHD